MRAGWRCEIGLRVILPLLLVGSSLLTEGRAQSKGSGKRTSTAISMRSETQGTITVSFASAPDGASLSGATAGQRKLNLGTVSNYGGAQTANVRVQTFTGFFAVSTKFGLSIQDGSQHSTTATVLAALATPDTAFTYRLDGITLATVPQLLQGQARIGPTIEHLLEIDVPTSLTEKNSQLNNAIIFQVIPN
ncbi:MAG TPA: hypothetical protein VKH81_19060 [Candidatus Angelobacter sp.]|nr:hypothetical protein [Candidatus Angelobacter sp.]